MKTRDLRALTGISQGQLNGARTRGDLNPMQFVDGGDCYYLPENVLAIHRQILTERKLGTAKLRKSPNLKQQPYKKVIRSLERAGYVVDDIKDLVVHADGTVKVDYKPYLLSTEDSAPVVPPTEARVEATKDVEVLEEPDINVPDKLPFPFWLGNEADLPTHEEAASDFENVFSGCFGYFDRTSEACRNNCQFQSSCAAMRFRILTAIGQEKDKGGDEQAIRAAVESERNLMANKIRNSL